MKQNSSGRARGVDDKYVLTESDEHGIAVAKTSLTDTVNLDVPSLTAKSVPQVVDVAVVLAQDGQYYRTSIGTLLNVPSLTCRIDVFTDVLTIGIWNKPAGAAWVYLCQISGGGGGGSGYKYSTGVETTGSGGAGGGGGGAIDYFMVPAALLPSRLACRISTGGIGNPAQVDAGGGTVGNTAGLAQIGILPSGYVINTGGGAGGGAGSNTGGVGGDGGAGIRFTGGVGGNGNEAGNGGAGSFPGGGGGGGGWENSVDYNGGAGGRGWSAFAGGTGGAKGNMVAEGSNGSVAVNGGLTTYTGLGGGGGGGGGGSGAYSLDPGYSAGDGAAGTYPGGGGGGGAGSTTGRGNNSGFGGAGANGLTYIGTFF